MPDQICLESKILNESNNNPVFQVLDMLDGLITSSFIASSIINKMFEKFVDENVG